MNHVQLEDQFVIVILTFLQHTRTSYYQPKASSMKSKHPANNLQHVLVKYCSLLIIIFGMQIEYRKLIFNETIIEAYKSIYIL